MEEEKKAVDEANEAERAAGLMAKEVKKTSKRMDELDLGGRAEAVEKMLEGMDSIDLVEEEVQKAD